MRVHASSKKCPSSVGTRTRHRLAYVIGRFSLEVLIGTPTVKKTGDPTTAKARKAPAKRITKAAIAKREGVERPSRPSNCWNWSGNFTRKSISVSPNGLRSHPH
ncbi:unnamed protein product [Nesidiocoris tenuis]|uniref:Uncharacterized protein n=1 Tax=Nesidiocoris tenuis TaxID=355587 RepID=A0A6H5G3R7_9HEMI|nr:unnamed protein product [Nesidiocoris tenuis]